MIIVALTLGLFGSLHCLGMCGPIAFGFQKFNPHHRSRLLLNGIIYNSGRILTYTFLGFVLGVIGQAFWVSGIQKTISVVAGIFFIFLFFKSMDLEQVLFRIPGFRFILSKYSNFISTSFSERMYHNGFVLGIINGLIPCGLVYIALAGALLEGDIISSMTFMFLFGLGTFPMMFFVVVGSGYLNFNSRKIFTKVTPYLQLAMGMWFMYRGLSIDYPMDIDFYLSLKDGPLCH